MLVTRNLMSAGAFCDGKDVEVRYKLIATMKGSQGFVAVEKIEFQSILAASQFNGDFWNTRFAWSDRFRSTLYVLSDSSHRWQKVEVIN